MTSVKAVSAGPHAFRTLGDEVYGTVHSLFERSLYVRLGDRLICIGPRELGAGPLNLLCESWLARGEPAKRWRIGETVRTSGATLHVGATLTVDCAALAEWRPPAVVHVKALAAGLAALGPLLDRLPADGLGRLLFDDPRTDTAILRVARPALHAMADFIRRDAATAPAECIALLGLGPGLTPSGDDFLGGAMITLALLGKIEHRDALWHALRPHIAERTSEISAAHLAAASDGFGHAALHECLAAIAAGHDSRKAFDALACLGHTSGLDALAGAVEVLRAHATRG